MKCRRTRDELLWLARFGEFGPSSQPHLEHLAACRRCRDEVGYDREMVRLLRSALAQRIQGMEPSPMAWDAILRGVQSPEPGRVGAWLARFGAVAARLRTSTAMAGTGLALLLALNMEVIPVATPPTTDAAPEAAATALQQVPRIPTGRTSLVVLARRADDRVTAGVAEPDPEQAMTGARVATTKAAHGPSRATAAADIGVVFRPMQSPEPSSPGVGGAAEAADDVSRAGSVPAAQEVGRPS